MWCLFSSFSALNHVWIHFSHVVRLFTYRLSMQIICVGLRSYPQLSTWNNHGILWKSCFPCHVLYVRQKTIQVCSLWNRCESHQEKETSISYGWINGVLLIWLQACYRYGHEQCCNSEITKTTIKHDSMRGTWLMPSTPTLFPGGWLQPPLWSRPHRNFPDHHSHQRTNHLNSQLSHLFIGKH